MKMYTVQKYGNTIKTPEILEILCKQEGKGAEV